MAVPQGAYADPGNKIEVLFAVFVIKIAVFRSVNFQKKWERAGRGKMAEEKFALGRHRMDDKIPCKIGLRL
jgi:hypothetical protein